MKKNEIKLWAVLFWLLVWQVAAFAIDSQILLVSPIGVLLRLTQFLFTAVFWRAVFFSFIKISAGFLIAVLIGGVLAAASYRFEVVKQLLAPAMAAIKSIPVASFIILALVWLSSKNLSIFISFLMVMPIIYTNVLAGIYNCDNELLEMADVFKMSPWRKVRYIYLLQVVPFFYSGCAAALGFCWKAGIAAEVIAMPQGSIGERLQQAKVYLDTPDLFAWTVVIVIISYLFERLFLAFVKYIQHKLMRV